MKIEVKRQLSAWLLLSVFVPMMVLTALHVHSWSDTDELMECDACVHHIPHGGHLSNDVVDWDDCVLCQLMVTLFLASSFELLAFLATQHRVILPSFTAQLAARPCSVHGSRAPPVG